MRAAGIYDGTRAFLSANLHVLKIALVLILITRSDIMGTLRPPLSRFFAVVLVLLTASPFTAPFQTFDLSAPVGETPADAASCGDKVSKDCAMPALIDSTVPGPCSAPPAPPARETIPQHAPVTRAVLRV